MGKLSHGGRGHFPHAKLLGSNGAEIWIQATWFQNTAPLLPEKQAPQGTLSRAVLLAYPLPTSCPVYFNSNNCRSNTTTVFAPRGQGLRFSWLLPPQGLSNAQWQCQEHWVTLKDSNRGPLQGLRHIPAEGENRYGNTQARGFMAMGNRERLRWTWTPARSMPCNGETWPWGYDTRQQIAAQGLQFLGWNHREAYF